MSQEGLATVHHAQAHTIPFENFDIALGRDIDLKPEAIFQKLVRSPRGGYCFEINGLLTMALCALGFDVRRALGRVHYRGEPTPRTHQVAIATVEGQRWLCDVGFGGGCLRTPLPLIFDQPQEQESDVFRLVQDPVWGSMAQTLQGGDWRNLYSFDLTHVGPADIVMANYFTSTHPASFFTANRVATRPTPHGRVSLLNNELREVSFGQETARTVCGGQDYLDTLSHRFGIVLDAPYEALDGGSDAS